MPFGLVNAPGTFQRYIHLALRGLVDEFVLCYLDDILVFSQSIEDHWVHVRKTLERLWEYKEKQPRCVCALFTVRNKAVS